MPTIEDVLQDMANEIAELRDMIERRRAYTPNKFKGQQSGSSFGTADLEHYGDYGVRSDGHAAQYNMNGGIELLGGRFMVPFTVYRHLPYALSTAETGYDIFTASTPYPNLYILDWYQALYIGTPLDGSNYWNIHLIMQGGANISTIDTSSHAAGYSQGIETGINTLVDPTVTDEIGLRIRIESVGSPGSLFMFGPIIFAALQY